MSDQTIDDATRRAVLQQVRRCMDHLVGGSGHLSSYVLDAETFVIVKAEPLDGGLWRFHFRVEGGLVTEFGEATDEPHEPDPWDLGGTEQLEGSLVLDEHNRIALDAEGRVRLRPWRTLDPSFWLQQRPG